VLPIPPKRTISIKQEKPAASSSSVAVQEKESATNVKLEIGSSSVRKGSARQVCLY
jgi:hypothetical protein